MIRIDSGENIQKLETTSLSNHDFREDNLREWIMRDTQSILGEEILLIGREVSVRNIGDAIDLVGIDRDGNTVVIELKRGSVKGDVDFQAMKYAAYTSHWDYEKLRGQFEKFKETKWGSELYDDETTFTEGLDEFCNEDYTLNKDQRIMLVGESLRDRLSLVLRWLSDRDIDITVVEFQVLSDEDRLYLDAEQTIPVQEKSVTDVSPDTSEEPWKKDGRSWHLEERSNDETAEFLETIVPAIEDIEFLDGPNWGQKYYISFEQDKQRCISIRTKRTLFHIDVYDVSVDEVEIDELSESIGISEEDITASEDLRGNRSGVRVTCRPGQEIELDSLSEEVHKLLATRN